ncbi:uncharacterized protein LOC110932014 [Helianthus annuus]|uniref:uncharacterized protein LOC110932014 n=1 Tax=Helianthus annuus TaxID=4232 RepID=UPI000B8F2379|nr:uncharacterized protein LOC110932014 [Helianthus annuus]
MEVIVMFIKNASELGLFKGVDLPNQSPTVTHLCYADNIIFMGEWSDKNAVSLSRFLREISRLAGIINCGVGSFPFVYLGLPNRANLKRVKFWEPVVRKFQKKLSSWKAKTLSFAGRVTLAKAVLGSLPSYFLGVFRAPKSVLNTLKGLRRSFIWGNWNDQ